MYEMQLVDRESGKWMTWYRSPSLDAVREFCTKNAWEYLAAGMGVRVARVVPETGRTFEVLDYYPAKQ